MPHEPSHAGETASEAMLIASKLVETARIEERERCAKIAESWKSPLRPGTEARRLGHDEAAREIATAIRNKD